LQEGHSPRPLRKKKRSRGPRRDERGRSIGFGGTAIPEKKKDWPPSRQGGRARGGAICAIKRRRVGERNKGEVPEDPDQEKREMFNRAPGREGFQYAEPERAPKRTEFSWGGLPRENRRKTAFLICKDPHPLKEMSGRGAKMVLEGRGRRCRRSQTARMWRGRRSLAPEPSFMRLFKRGVSSLRTFRGGPIQERMKKGRFI